MPALFFDRCTAPVKLLFRQCPSRRKRAASSDLLLRRPAARPACALSLYVCFPSTLAERCDRSSGVALRLTSTTSVPPSQSRVTIESNSAGSSFSADPPKPVSLAVGLLESCHGQSESRSFLHARH